jgi:uncharacterized protein
MGGIRLGVAAVLCLIGAAPAGAASFPCRSPMLSATEMAICRDPQLSKADEDTARKAQALLRRLSYGQYLGLRYLQSRGADAREQCAQDRACLAAQYRAQNRILDGLRQCMDSGTPRRTCWRTLRNGGSVALPR